MLVLDKQTTQSAEKLATAIEMQEQNELAIKETEQGLNLKIEDLEIEDNRILYDFYKNVNLTKKTYG